MGTARRILTQILGRRLLPLETTPSVRLHFLLSFRKDLVLFFLSWPGWLSARLYAYWMLPERLAASRNLHSSCHVSCLLFLISLLLSSLSSSCARCIHVLAFAPTSQCATSWQRLPCPEFTPQSGINTWRRWRNKASPGAGTRCHVRGRNRRERMGMWGQRQPWPKNRK
jgi:hypothetical protein